MEPGDYFGDVKFTGGHEQTIVAVNNGDIDAGVTWADGLGNWEDGYNSGALRKASDAGLVDMNDLQEIWRSPVIPEGPIVLRKKLPEDVKMKMTALMAVVAVLVSGYSKSNDMNSGGFLQGLSKFFDYPGEIVVEAWEAGPAFFGLMVHYLPAMLETLNIAGSRRFSAVRWRSFWPWPPRATSTAGVRSSRWSGA
jgi:hypothetical protein